jgi:hypothetical protein
MYFYRVLTGTFSKGLFMLAFMISVEISGADYKTGLGILIQVEIKVSKLKLISQQLNVVN